MKHTLPILATLAFASPVLAENNRQLDAHEHGVGELNIAFDGKTVAMELHAPGADIVGFEYEAESEEDRAAIDSAVAILAKPQELFVLPKGAECTVTQASAGLESEEEHDDHDEHAEGEDEHDDHAKGEEEHDEHEEHAEGEDEHDDHAKGEEEHDEHEEHAEG
ncbi:MAG: ZrgA family zinc uptake protein, partial [Paracoccaceae bacterium]